MKKIITGYIFFLLLFSTFSYLFIDKNLIYLKLFYSGLFLSQRHLVAIVYVLFIFLFFCFYVYFLKKWKEITDKQIKLLIIVIGLILLFSYPAMLSYDIFNYILTGKVLFFYKENPYVVMPVAFLGDPYLLFTQAANKIALYGPFWILLSGIPYLLGFKNFLLILFNFKLFNLLFYIGAVFLFSKIAKGKFSLMLFSFNPLILIETLVSGHNDILMIFLILLSIYFFKMNTTIKSIAVFVCSIFIKYASFILLPIYLYLIILRKLKKKIHWEKIYLSSFFIMFFIFLFSAFREEIYPWYGVWFLPFAFLIPKNKIILNTSLAFSLSLMLRYMPYLYTGTYASSTPILKTIITFSLPALIFVSTFLKEKYA